MQVTSARAWALFLTVLSAFVVGLLAFVSGIVLPEVRSFYKSQQSELPEVTRWLLLNLARHNNALIAHVVFWFWFPMLWNLVRAHRKFRDEAEFAREFLFGFAAAWLSLIGLLIVIAMFVAAPMIILLMEIGPPPSPIAGAIPSVTGGLLIVSVLYVGRAIWAQSRISTRRKRGMCVACGYDLRASGSRCPECGELAKPESDRRRSTHHTP